MAKEFNEYPLPVGEKGRNFLEIRHKPAPLMPGSLTERAIHGHVTRSARILREEVWRAQTEVKITAV